MPADYRLFPKVCDSQKAKYSLKPLPGLPTDYRLTVQSSASYESLLEHDVPSPSLFQSDEIDKQWSRWSSQYSIYSVDSPSCPELSRSGSLDTIAETFDRLRTPNYREHRETLLPPTPQRSNRRAHAVETSLSSTSADITTPPASPLVSKRSCTPTLLEQFSSSLEELSIIHKHQASSVPPNTPVLSLSTAGSLSTLCEDSPTNTPAIMDINHLSSRSKRQGKPSNITLSGGSRNISPPMPSPVSTNGLFGPPLARVGDASYQECRPPPHTPDVMHEVSCIEWDDDEETRLTRMKKSFTDLRAAGRKNPSSPPQPPMKQISAPVIQPIDDISHSSKMTSPSPPTIPPIAAVAKLTKKPSVKIIRKRGWSHNSALSDKSSNTKVGTPSSTSTATALPRAESPHLTKRKRFSIAATSKRSAKGKKVSMRSFKRWMGRLFGC